MKNLRRGAVTVLWGFVGTINGMPPQPFSNHTIAHSMDGQNIQMEDSKDVDFVQPELISTDMLTAM